MSSRWQGAPLLLSAVLVACDRPAPKPASDLSLAMVAPVARGADDAAAPERLGPTSIRVLIGGDVLPHRPSLSTPSRVTQALAPLASLLSGADIAVANYETSTGDPHFFGQGKNMSLAAPPDWMGEIAHANLRALTVANNHACDLGKSGLEATLAAARSFDVVALGGDDVDPWRAAVLEEKGGRRVCAVAWTTIVNGGGSCKRSGKLAIAGLDRKGSARIEHAIQGARADGCDAVVAILHGGREYAPQIWGPKQQARRAAEAGADAVVIHHPHVPSPVDVVTTPDGRRVPIFESVGNLVSNQGESWEPSYPPESPRHLVSLNAWTRLGVLADLEWTWPATTDAPSTAAAGGASPTRAHPALSWGYHLVWTDNDHVAHKSDPVPNIEVRPLDPTADHLLIERLATDERGPKGILFDDCWLEASKKRCDSSRGLEKQNLF
jgi:poly-gamma-glutamate synthesis protein (capsule biosynthesis protein)